MTGTRKTKLQVVRPEETAANPARRPATVAQAAASGNRRNLLVAMRDRVAMAVSDPDCPKRDLASLTKRLQEIATAIDLLDARDQESGAGGDVGEVDDRFDPAAI